MYTLEEAELRLWEHFNTSIPGWFFLPLKGRDLIALDLVWGLQGPCRKHQAICQGCFIHNLLFLHFPTHMEEIHQHFPF